MITERMRAWGVLDGRLSWVDIETPSPSPGNAVVRVALAGLCGSDVAKLEKAVIPTPAGQLWQPGHEIVGWSKDGDGRERFVAVNPLVSCGKCRRCRDGDVNVCPWLRTVGWHLPGGFAPYVAVPQRSAIEVPHELDTAVAVLTEPMAVAIHGVRCGLPKPAGRLAVIGGGLLGVASAAYAKSVGWETQVLVRDSARLAVVQDALGVEIRGLASVSAGEFDAVIDAASGVDDTPLLAALHAVRDGGTIVVQTAYYPGVRLSRDLRDPIRRGLTIVGSFTFCRRNGDDFEESLAFLGGDDAWAKPFVAHRYALADLPSALADLRIRGPGRPLKVVLSTT